VAGDRGVDGVSELDLQPPHDVRIRVADSSVADYERAELMVRVRAALDRRHSREDIEYSPGPSEARTARR